MQNLHLCYNKKQQGWWGFVSIRFRIGRQGRSREKLLGANWFSAGRASTRRPFVAIPSGTYRCDCTASGSATFLLQKENCYSSNRGTDSQARGMVLPAASHAERAHPQPTSNQSICPEPANDCGAWNFSSVASFSERVDCFATERLDAAGSAAHRGH